MLDAALIAGLNHLLDGAGWARARLAPFAGRLAAFEMPPFRLALAITDAGRFEPAPEATGAPDVSIRLPPDAPFMLAQGLEKIMAAARVEGNAEFATELSFVFRHLHWDAEEDLSRIVGDIAARRMVQGADRLAAWHRQAASNLGENVAAYLVDENPVLVGTHEFTQFRAEVARLNAALLTLEKRVKL